MGIPFIDLKKQYALIEDSVNDSIRQVLEHGRFIMGPEVGELEQLLAEYVGVRHCIAVASGTDALLIAMMALGIGQGDEVITTPFTFIATAETIALLGAIPVFVDVESDTCNIDPELIEAAVTDRTRAIMPVSLYGQCADMDAINVIAEKHGIPVIEDGCQSFGATMNGERSCGLSTIGVTSFFPSKPLGCYGDGGACFTDDDELARVMREIRVHGQDRRYHHARIGVNGRLDTLQAAVLKEKMKIFPDEVERRQQVGQRYSDQLKQCCQLQIINKGYTSVYAQYTIMVDDRDKVVDALQAADIPTAIHYPCPLHLQPAFEYLGQGESSFPVAEELSGKVLSLPMHPYLEPDEQDQVIGALMNCLGHQV